MGSWQARCASWTIRALLRRAAWGEPRALALRARRIFGVRQPLGWLWARGVQISQVEAGGLRGEWLRAGNGDRGVLYYLHGGGYVACSPATHRPITAALARLTGRRVFALDYRLAPEHPFPAAPNDAVAAYRWLLDQGIKPASIVVAGDSAGGGLVLATLVRARSEDLPLPSAAVCFSPWTDLSASGASLLTNNGRCAMFRPENVSAFAKVYLADASPRHPYASPIFADLSGLPPILLQVGSTEILLDDARRIHDKIQALGGDSTLEIFDDVPHVWHIFDGLIPEARAALRQAATFIATPTTGDRATRQSALSPTAMRSP